MKKLTKGLLAGAGLAVGAAAVSHGITSYMVRLALDREAPPLARKATEKRERTAWEDPLFRRALEEGLELERRPHHTIEINARDGEVLVGHWFPVAQPRRIVLAMHGWRSAWYRDFGGIADFLREQGCSVLYAEQRGQHASTGDYMGFGMLERYEGYTLNEIVTPEGENVMGEEYYEFYPEEEKLDELILRLFYAPKK